MESIIKIQRAAKQQCPSWCQGNCQSHGTLWDVIIEGVTYPFWGHYKSGVPDTPPPLGYILRVLSQEHEKLKHYMNFRSQNG